ncbi:glycosyltransferase [Candidatus Reidiella endopervernicosa]|uniref:Glycosyltransferase n=2 Tax=Candidatus Reidiella endopervernicosa TaxID=2738883 RepID=A0A6N0HUS9_9GAMM|nr:glycosyltransferase [Candidatus Reidiella endopervernicosa]
MAPVRGRFDLKVALRLLWNRREISLVHTHLGRASSLVGWLFKNSDVMTVATLHGMQKLRHYKNIKHFVAVSEAVRRHYVAQGLDDEKITIIPNGYEEMIDRYTGSGLRRELALPAGAPRGGLATALERLCGDTELRSRMGAHAKASVTGMEWGTIEQRYMSLFETLLAEQGEPPTVDRDD